MSCVATHGQMFKFGGFKASFSLSSRKRNDREDDHGVSIVGAYRVNTSEYNGYGRTSNAPNRVSRPTIPAPTSRQSAVRPSKSTNDLTVPTRVPANLNNSTPDVSYDPRGGTNNNRDLTDREPKSKQSADAKKQEKELKKLEKSEKRRLAEQRKREKSAAQQQARLEKQRAQQEAKQKAAEKSKKKNAPTPPPRPSANPLAQTGPASIQYSTNTLESSISKSSGPPPYSELSVANKPIEGTQHIIPDIEISESSSSGNVSFGKSIDNYGSSWDMISQHRQQINQPRVVQGSYNRHLNLQYHVGNSQTDKNDNSDA